MFKGLVCISIAVKSIEESLPAFRDGLGLEVIGSIQRGKRGYGLRFVELGRDGKAFLELVDSPGDGPVKRFLDKRGEGFYQLRLGTDNVYDTVKELQGRGVNVILPQPVDGGDRMSEATPDIDLAFVHPSSAGGVLIELVNTK